MMLDALRVAGFVGVEQQGDVIYARCNAAQPEFTVCSEGAIWRFALCWPLRASPAQMAEWAAKHPDAPLDVDLGETRLQFWGKTQDLPKWADLAAEMTATCTLWRRRTRQMDEGM